MARLAFRSQPFDDAIKFVNSGNDVKIVFDFTHDFCLQQGKSETLSLVGLHFVNGH